MKLALFFVLLSVFLYTECVGTGLHHRRIRPFGRFNDRSVTLLLRDTCVQLQESAVVIGIRESVLDTLIRVARVDPRFEFSFKYSSSAGVQLTGINGISSTWEVLRSPTGDTSEVPITSGLETLVPDSGDTIIFERKRECVPVDNLSFVGSPETPSVGDILSDTGVEIQLNDQLIVEFASLNIKEVCLEYVTEGQGDLLIEVKLDGTSVVDLRFEPIDSMGSLSIPINIEANSLNLFRAPGIPVTIKNLCIQAGE